MKLAHALLAGHALTLIFCVMGIAIALPNPQLWADDPIGRQVFAFGMERGGMLQIALAAAAMSVAGGVTIGWRRTLLFAAVTVAISLSYELLGTGTGFPFGAYSYTDGLGAKVLERVPFTIPLSWFYMGFACYVLGQWATARWKLSPRTLWPVLLGAWLLTGWDTILDPAMAHPDMPLKFWVWHETGPYFGMPAKNFVGWVATGLSFMAAARLLWRCDVTPPPALVRFSATMLALNLAFGVALSLHIGLWAPALVALTVGVAPVWLVALSGGKARRPVQLTAPTDQRAG